MVLTYFVLRLLFGEDKFFFKAFKSNLKYVKGNSISNIISANIVWKQDKVKYDYLNSLLLRRYGKVNKPLVNRNYTKDKLVKK